MTRLFRRVHEAFLGLAKEHTSPPRLAAAVGIGAFVGTTPFFGFHTPIAIVLSRVLRLNVIAMTIGTQVSLPFLAPLLVFASLQLGHFSISGEWLEISRHELDLAFAKQLFGEWLLGSIFVGSGLGVLGYFVTLGAVTALRKRESTKWSGRSRGTGLGYAIFFHTMRLLGRRAGYLLLLPVTAYFFMFAWKGRRVSQDYLRRVLGPRTFLQRQRDTWLHFQSLGRSIADRILTMAGRRDEFTMEHENVERIVNAYRAGKGVVLLSAHLGSWTVAGESFESGIRPTIVVFENEVESIRRFFARHQSGKQPKLIAVNNGPTSAIEILSSLRQGEVVAILADRFTEGSATVTVPFLGEPARFPSGPFMVAVLSGCPVILTFSMKEGSRHHHFFALPARELAQVPRDRRDAAIRDLAGWFASELENVVTKYPYQWYNFYDFWASSRDEK